MPTFHPNSIDGFERNLKRLREQLGESTKKVERCQANLVAAEEDHAELLAGIADSENLLAYMRFSNEQQAARDAESQVA